MKELFIHVVLTMGIIFHLWCLLNPEEVKLKKSSFGFKFEGIFDFLVERPFLYKLYFGGIVVVLTLFLILSLLNT